MKKYIFLNVPATGHVNPTLPIVQELVQCGEQVIYYLTEEFRAIIEATGAIFRPYESFLGGFGPGPMPLKMAEESRRVLPQVLESIRAEQPDALLYEAMCLWGRIVAQVLQVEAIVLRASYAANEHFGLFTARSYASMPFPSELLERFHASSAELSATYHLPSFDLRQFVAHAEGLNVVLLPAQQNLIIGPG
ncbi:hypothetical protein KSD_69550 [Ktedonobacter sp. SOSP1-85]|uniref:hypothetical protein n=1 Tax=Ktedonobacter sp. SOSP1-85 TaxID=2778367 RepID=UPI0019161FF1|nr:hypothetical protein [Ktedonobacter sp. SOSP1-85]GHO79184.1 hypothetical protein KSD_69550 [Ktedonobacter sp. SOSP1-85]